MKAYNRDRYLKKGYDYARKRHASGHRKRCFRVNKRGARQDGKRSLSLAEE